MDYPPLEIEAPVCGELLTSALAHDLAQVLERSNDAVVALDAQGCLIYLNPKAEQLLSVSRDEALGQSLSQVFHKAHGCCFFTEIHRSRSEELLLTCDDYVEQLDIWLETSIYPFPEATIVHFRDVTSLRRSLESFRIELEERRRAEGALRDSESFLRGIFDSSPDCLKVLDINGKLMSMNQPGQCVMEIDDISQLVGLDWCALWPQTSDGTIQASIDAARRGEPSRFQGFCPTAKGTPKWWDVQVTPIFDAEGRPTSILSVSRDITEQRHWEEELRRQRDFIGAISESVADGIYAVDAAGVITYANPAAEQILGWTQAELIDHDAHAIAHYKRRDGSAISREECRLLSVLATGVTINDYETAFVRKDGSLVPVSCSSAPLKADGRVTGAVVGFTDISERRQREKERAAEAAKQRHIAETLQRSLLLTPLADAYPGITVEGFYEAALDEAMVGGDFSDVYSLGDRIALIVGDVTGKGLAAAAYTAEIKFALRVLLREHRVAPLALERLNEYLVDAREVEGRIGSTFVALSLALIDPVSGEMSVCSAGMEPPLVIRGDSGEIEEMSAGGTLLGAFSEGEYPVLKTVVRPGDLIAMTSDGITESRRGKEFFGLEGFAESLKRRRTDQSLHAIGEAAIRDAIDYAEGLQQDDICLLLARKE